MGKHFASPQVHTHRYLAVMDKDEDLYEARRDVLKRLIHTRYSDNQAEFARAAGLASSYVSRMLKGPGEANRKRIGDDTARRLEGIAELGLSPGMLVNPVLSAPARQGLAPLQDRLSPDEQELVNLFRQVASSAIRMKALGYLQGLAHGDAYGALGSVDVPVSASRKRLAQGRP